MGEPKVDEGLDNLEEVIKISDLELRPLVQINRHFRYRLGLHHHH